MTHQVDSLISRRTGCVKPIFHSMPERVDRLFWTKIHRLAEMLVQQRAGSIRIERTNWYFAGMNQDFTHQRK